MCLWTEFSSLGCGNACHEDLSFHTRPHLFLQHSQTFCAEIRGWMSLPRKERNKRLCDTLLGFAECVEITIFASSLLPRILSFFGMQADATDMASCVLQFLRMELNDISSQSSHLRSRKTTNRKYVPSQTKLLCIPFFAVSLGLVNSFLLSHSCGLPADESLLQSIDVKAVVEESQSLTHQFIEALQSCLPCQAPFVLRVENLLCARIPTEVPTFLLSFFLPNFFLCWHEND